MTPSPRTPQQRDRRFARIRRLTQGLLLGSGVVSGLLVTYIASGAKPYTTVPVTVPSSTSGASPATPATPPTTTTPSTTAPTSNPGTTKSTPAPTTPTTVYTPPTTAPVTTTTVCYSTPSGTVTCN
ncbi:MAG: hypothetical protein KGJ10_03800 [Acidobacteriota bacterium]|nr:hypothetical protein [Acidobacteriota bacterium]